MIKVLEHGSLKVKCPNCKAKLEYFKEDIQIGQHGDALFGFDSYEYIICPDCNSEVVL